MKKRFYDQEPALSQAVELMLVFPEEFQQIIANGMATIMDREFEANKLLDNIKSLGTEKVLAIYKSKQKKRTYDQNPIMHQAMNYLLVLSPENCMLVAKRVVELVGYVQEYLKTCKDFTVTPETEAVENLTNAYVRFGSEEAKQFLKEIEKEFTEKIKKPEPPANRSAKEAIQDAGGHGMACALKATFPRPGVWQPAHPQSSKRHSASPDPRRRAEPF